MLVTIDTQRSAGLVCATLHQHLEDRGAKGVSVTLVDAGLTEMPMGKYKGRLLTDVPGEYWDHIMGESWIESWPLLVDWYLKNQDKISYAEDIPRGHDPT